MSVDKRMEELGHRLVRACGDRAAYEEVARFVRELLHELEDTKQVLRDALDERPDVQELHALREEVERLRKQEYVRSRRAELGIDMSELERRAWALATGGIAPPPLSPTKNGMNYCQRCRATFPASYLHVCRGRPSNR